MSEPKRLLKVFLCHARADKQKVRELYRYLLRRRIKPWFDEVDLVGGQDWQVEIPKALATSDAIIICLTKNSVDKEGYIQKEIKFALDKALEMPEGRIFLIPVRFEECEVPFSLSRYQWVDLFDEAGYARMMRALKFRATQLERATVELPKPSVFIEEEKIPFEKNEQESIEKAVRDKAEREAADKAAREKDERETAEMARREKAEQEVAAENALREKIKRDAAERAKRERIERQATRKAAVAKALNKFLTTLKSVLTQARPFFGFVGIIGIFVILFWGGSLAIPKFISLIPTSQTTSTQSPVVNSTSTNTSIIPSKTPKPNATPTKTLPPAPTPTLGIGSIMIGKDGMTLLYVPAGNFLMGTGESWNHPNEIFHTVYLEAFWIDKTEVTNKMYALCVTDGICKEPANTSSSTRSNYYGNPQYDNYPVIYLNWNKAETYCEWAGRQLPTEAQWEKAARGTDANKGYIGDYPWKDYMIDCSFANYKDSKVCVGDTTEVGNYPKGASPYGALDMAGNVWEWIADWYDATYYTSSPASNPLGPSSGQYRVLRGGSWSTFYVSTSYRSWYNPAFAGDNTGFRCAKGANP